MQPRRENRLKGCTKDAYISAEMLESCIQVSFENQKKVPV